MSEENYDMRDTAALAIGIFAWIAAFGAFWQILGPREGMDVRQLITFYFANKVADYVGNKALNFVKPK